MSRKITQITSFVYEKQLALFEAKDVWKKMSCEEGVKKTEVHWCCMLVITVSVCKSL